MADLAIGISKTAVEALMKKVKTAIKEEAELWQIVQHDTMFMKDEFEMMQSFLNTSDWEQIKNNVARTWVRQVRDLSYDAEDCIESILLLDTKRSFWTLWLRLVASCKCNSAAQLPLDQAVSEIKLLKARVEEVSKRNIRYNLINDSSAGSNRVMPQPLGSASAIGTTTVDILTEAWSTEKKQGGLVDLTMLVTEKCDALRVISLWGTGGNLGMSSIIKEAYEKPEICQKFRCRAWLKLAHPFDPCEFIRSLAEQFYRNSCKDGGAIKGIDILTGVKVDNRTDLVKEFVEQLSKHRYLVVLEDLSIMAEWHSVQTWLPDSKNGSRIVVSTQQLEAARLCAGQPYQVLELRKLPDNQSICVFFNEGFKRVEVGIVDSGSSLSQVLQSVQLVGRQSDGEVLSNLILLASTISVWGFPGVGKSTLVKSILFRLQSNNTSPFKCYIWVDVSYPFKLSDLCWRILSYKPENDMFKPGQAKPDYQEIIIQCSKFLQQNHCLLVIDGLRSNEDWDSISSLMLPGLSKTCIIVVTAEEKVAKHCAVRDDAMHRVKALDPEATFQLFTKEFQGTETFRDAHTLMQAKHILAKCGGIPEVIMAFARYVATQQGDIQQRKLNHLKANFIHELETNPEFVSLRDLFAWVHFQFDALPHFLKPCILYLPVFSEVKRIRKSHFVRRWIAEGYSKCTNSKTMEEHAANLFDTLTEVTASMGEWRVNRFFLEYINSRLMEERVVFFPPVVSVLDGSPSRTTERIGQHLAIGSRWKRDDSVFDDWDLSELQSLTVSGEWRPSFISYIMKSLRVLDLQDAKNVTHDELKRILELVPRLRFLSLRGLNEITCLPDSLFGLRHLQTLDIRHTSIVHIELQNLQELQYIRAGTTVRWLEERGLATKEGLPPSSKSTTSRSLVSCLPKCLRPAPSGSWDGVKLSRGIRHLKDLHTLGAINVSSADGGMGILDDIGLLKQLQKLEVSGINQKNSKKLSKAILNQKNLESLTLKLEKENHVVRWDDVSPPSSVRSFKLYGHVEKLSPRRFKTLHNLWKLVLEMTVLFTGEIIEVIGSLPSLRTLHLLVNKGQDGEIQFPNLVNKGQDGARQFSVRLFTKLQVLEITCKSTLNVSFSDDAMEKLEVLKVHCCNDSSLQLSGLEHENFLRQLMQVWLLGSYNETLKEVLRTKLDAHPKKPALLLQRSSQQVLKL